MTVFSYKNTPTVKLTCITENVLPALIHLAFIFMVLKFVSLDSNYENIEKLGFNPSITTVLSNLLFCNGLIFDFIYTLAFRVKYRKVMVLHYPNRCFVRFFIL